MSLACFLFSRQSGSAGMPRLTQHLLAEFKVGRTVSVSRQAWPVMLSVAIFLLAAPLAPAVTLADAAFSGL